MWDIRRLAPRALAPGLILPLIEKRIFKRALVVALLGAVDTRYLCAHIRPTTGPSQQLSLAGARPTKTGIYKDFYLVFTSVSMSPVTSTVGARRRLIIQNGDMYTEKILLKLFVSSR